MRTLARDIFRNRWIRTLFGAVILAVVVWIFGPLLGIGSMHPLDSELVRYIVIAVIFIGWLVENLIHKLRANKKEKELAPILRPHDEIGLHKTRELEAIEQRWRLDVALGDLTLLEIGFETGLLAEEKNRDNAWQQAGLTGSRLCVCKWLRGDDWRVG